MNLQTRIEKLELAHDPELCGCVPGGSEIRRYDGAEDEEAAADADLRPPVVCVVCRRVKRIIQIVRTKRWGTTNEFDGQS